MLWSEHCWTASCFVFIPKGFSSYSSEICHDGSKDPAAASLADNVPRSRLRSHWSWQHCSQNAQNRLCKPVLPGITLKGSNAESSRTLPCDDVVCQGYWAVSRYAALMSLLSLAEPAGKGAARKQATKPAHSGIIGCKFAFFETTSRSF